MYLLNKINNPSDLKKLNKAQMNDLAQEIRDYIINVVNKNGGHLASNLGTVELSLALHYVFDTNIDKLIFDVGHQCYTHKILTGRRDEFKTLRQTDGLSGFPKTSESVHDACNTGHSSTSISTAIGMCKARELSKEDYNVACVIGDGSISSGMAFEALNNMNKSHSKMLIILNDNEMSISKNVGAVSDQLSKIRVNRKYLKLKNNIKNALNNIPFFGNELEFTAKKTRNIFKNILLKGMIFEHFGLKYLGPVDGHNIPEMIRLFKQASEVNEPVIIHLLTQKGRGLSEAEKNPAIFHGVSPSSNKKAVNFSKKIGEYLCDLASNNEKITAISAAMTINTGLGEFEKKFSDRMYDVGISEQHAVTMASGLALCNYRPYVAMYSTFLQRAYDQILHDVCLQNLPVTFCIDRAGLNPGDGETHHGIYDIAFLKNMPNIEILTPSTFKQLELAIKYSENTANPVAIRYPSGGEIEIKDECSDIKKWQYVKKSDSKTTILAVGSRMLDIAIKASEIKDFNVVCVTSVKPLDTELLSSLDGDIITMEDGIKNGGFYSSINDYFVNSNKKIYGFGYEDEIIPCGTLNDLLKMSNITVDSVVNYEA